MSEFETNLIRANDARMGRVIPVWRYSVMYIFSLAVIGAGRVLPDGFWISFGLGLVWVIGYAALIGRFKMRTVS